jgi:hypothetical protein
VGLNVIAPRRERDGRIELLVVDVAVSEGLDAVAFTDSIFCNVAVEVVEGAVVEVGCEQVPGEDAAVRR